MQRRLAVLVLAGLVVLAGCAAEDPGSDDPLAGETSTPVPDAPAEGELEIHAINVGQADATLLVAPSGETILIDTGDWRDDGGTVIDYLEAHDIDRIDHLVATHAHADHIGGHAAVIEYYEEEKDGIGTAWDSGVPHDSQTYERYLDAIDEYDVTLFDAQEGDEIPVEGIDAEILNPPADPEDPDDLHDNSLTVHVQHGEIGFLSTGDAEVAAEAHMADEYGEDLAADIYHAGHHGSSTSSTAEFLDAVDPDAAIISASYDSQYGHPHDEVLERFDEYGIDAYWTATHGTIVFVSDGETVTVETQTDATTAPLDLRDEPETDADPADPTEERGQLSASAPAISLTSQVAPAVPA